MPDANIGQRVLSGVVGPPSRSMSLENYHVSVSSLWFYSHFPCFGVVQEPYRWPLRMQDILKSHLKEESSPIPGSRRFALLLGLVQEADFYERSTNVQKCQHRKKDLFFSFSNISIMDTNGMADYTRFTLKVVFFL